MKDLITYGWLVYILIVVATVVFQKKINKRKDFFIRAIFAVIMAVLTILYNFQIIDF